MNMDGGLLPCGTDIGDLVEQVAERGTGVRSPHQATCLACQRALTELEHRWSAVHQFREQPVTVPPGLVERIMRRVRASLDDERIQLLQELGVTEIPTRVLSTLAYWAAQGVPGVHQVNRVRATKAGPDELGEIALELSLDYGASAPGVTAAVRQAALEAVRRLGGVEARRVEILVSDVFSGAAAKLSRPNRI